MEVNRRVVRCRRRRLSRVLGESLGGDPKAGEFFSLLALVPPLDRTIATMTIVYVISPFLFEMGSCFFVVVVDIDFMGLGNDF